MRILHEGLDLQRFFSDVARAAHPVLLLDYDGTLAPFQIERDEAVPYPGVRELLAEIQACDQARLVVISGRSLDDLLPLLGLEKGVEVWGSHGWERQWPDGRRAEINLPPAAEEGLSRARAWCEEEGLGARCEYKPASVALHVRGMDQLEAAELLSRAQRAWTAFAAQSTLEVHAFNGGLELRVSGRDKGTAVKTILQESGSDVWAAYLGDDLTDEDAFRALAGKGLAVFVNQELRETEADLWIQPPDELLEFLTRWRDAVGGAHAR